MPRVPFVAGPQATEASLQGGTIPQVDVTAGQRRFAAGLGDLGDAVERIAVRQDQDQAWRTQAAINTEWVKFEQQSRQQSQGSNAAGYSTRVKDWWDKASADYGKELNPGARALVSKNLTIARAQAMEGALRFENVELERSRAEALDGALSAEVGRGSAGGPVAAAASVGIMTKMIQEFGAEKGKPPEWVEQQTKRYTTSLHANVISNLMQVDPTAAKAYFEAHKGEIDGARHDEIGNRLNVVAAAVDGDNKADAIWLEQGPKTDLQPVELDKLEKAARAAYPNDPTRRDATIAGIRQRAQAFNAAERERSAANTNAVYGMLDKGVGLARIQASPEWNALPERDQRQIKLQLEQQAAASEARAAAREQRAFTAEQRQDRQLLTGNADAYLAMTNPEMLATMTRKQVEASRSQFGFEGAQHLLQKWDALQKPGAIAEAKIDAQQFGAYAQEMGFTGNLKPEQKDQLVLIQNRVETMIDREQKAKGKALTREEKDTLMRREIASQVLVDNGWFSSDKSVPVVALTPDQAKNVVIPAADRAQIADALRTLYERTGSALYAPTEDNARRLYLMNKSRAGALVTP